MSPYDELPQPSFIVDGEFDLSTTEQQLAACIGQLRWTLRARQAYYSKGPAFQVEQIESGARKLLDELLATVRSGPIPSSEGTALLKQRQYLATLKAKGIDYSHPDAWRG